MSTTAEFPYQVVVTELPPIRAAYVDCVLDEQSGNFDERIREGFEVVKAWVAERGYKLANLRVIGIPKVSDTRLTGYACCVELPESVSMTSGKIGAKQLVGGRYAVLTLQKDSATIGEAIGRFHQEYVPQNRLTIDRQRPGYEIYSERFMDYCLSIERVVTLAPGVARVSHGKSCRFKQFQERSLGECTSRRRRSQPMRIGAVLLPIPASRDIGPVPVVSRFTVRPIHRQHGQSQRIRRVQHHPWRFGSLHPAGCKPAGQIALPNMRRAREGGDRAGHD